MSIFSALFLLAAQNPAHAGPLPFVTNPPVAAECSGAALGRAALTRCRQRLDGPRSQALAVTVTPEELPPLERGGAVEVTITVKNESTEPTVVALRVEGAPNAILYALQHTDLECVSGSGPVRTSHPPPPVTMAWVVLPPDGTLQWTRKIVAADHRLDIDRRKYVGPPRSGTPCVGKDVPLPRGTYTVQVPTYVEHVPTVAAHITVR